LLDFDDPNADILLKFRQIKME